MSDPIVTPLVDRLSLTSWLKPFFIHPSVTAGASHNMRNVREAQERLAAERKEKADRAKINTALTAIDAVVNPKDAVDFDADSQVIASIASTLRDIKPEPVVTQPPRSSGVEEEEEEEEAHAVAPSAIERSLFSLNQGLQDIFLSALRIKNEAAKKALLDAIAKANPKCKAYLDITAIVEKQENDDSLFDVKAVLRNDRNRGFDETLTALYDAIKRLPKDAPIKAPLLAAANALKPEEAKVHSDVREVLPAVNLKSKWTIALGSFWRAIGFHGYDKSSTVLTTARGKKFFFEESNRWHTLAAFMGLPSRVDSEGKTAIFSLRTFARVLFGGWVSLYNPDSAFEGRRLANSNFWMLNPRNYTLEGQRFWNLVLLLTGVKLVIAAYYLVTFPVKLALNIVRQVTETLPEALTNYSGKWYGFSSSAILELYYDRHMTRNQKLVRGFIALLMLAVSFPVHQVARLLAIVGTAATSPQESAREGWKTGLALDSRFRLVFATVLALSSLALTAVIWALTFPVLFAKALVVFPALAPVVTSISQLPIVASTITYVNGTATLVAGSLPAAFSTAATAISTAFGVTVSASTLAVATIWAVIAAPVASIATASANYASNAWTKWQASWTLLEAGSRAAADVAISAHTAILQLLPSEHVTALSNQFEKTYWNSVESENLLAAKQSEASTGRFDARKHKAADRLDKYETLNFPAVESSRSRNFDSF